MVRANSQKRPCFPSSLHSGPPALALPPFATADCPPPSAPCPLSELGPTRLSDAPFRFARPRRLSAADPDRRSGRAKVGIRPPRKRFRRQHPACVAAVSTVENRDQAYSTRRFASGNDARDLSDRSHRTTIAHGLGIRLTARAPRFRASVRHDSFASAKTLQGALATFSPAALWVSFRAAVRSGVGWGGSGALGWRQAEEERGVARREDVARRTQTSARGFLCLYPLCMVDFGACGLDWGLPLSFALSPPSCGRNRRAHASLLGGPLHAIPSALTPPLRLLPMSTLPQPRAGAIA